MDTLTRWTGIGAVVVSSFSLGMSGWAVGCHGRGAPEAEPSSVVASAAPRVVAVQDALPIATVSSSPAPAAQPTAAADETTAKAGARQDSPAAKREVNSGTLRVKRLVVARKVAAHEPVDPASSFALDGTPLVAFVEMENRTLDDAHIVITFEKPGEAVGHIELGVPANQARWRTWGMTRGIKDAGDWVAVVRTSDGTELARAPFAVTQGS